ncbi:MAG: hypothetical protein AAF355_16030 [Myxococcota bacterium]
MNWLRLLESLHGHLAILAVLSLLHPAWLLRSGRPLTFGTRAVVLASTGLVVTTFALGSAIYPSYRETLKRPLAYEYPLVANLFETKEHIAFMVTALSVSACICALSAPKKAHLMRKLAAHTYAAAAFACLIAFVLGVVVASFRSF